MTQEEQYRQQAVFFIKELNEARMLFANHKPSIGYVGEELLRLALRDLLPKEYGVCQGFVLNNEIRQKDNISRQFDIIVFRKGKQSVAYSIGELKVINAHSVVAVIEVKSSITKATFYSTLEAFKELEELRVNHNFIFVFNKITKQALQRWLLQYRLLKGFSEPIAIDTCLYDWSDKEWLPISVLSLESHKYYVLDYLQDDNNDWIGYVSYKITDKKNIEISCLQEFLANVINLTSGTFEINQNDYSIKDGFALYSM